VGKLGILTFVGLFSVDGSLDFGAGSTTEGDEGAPDGNDGVSPPTLAAAKEASSTQPERGSVIMRRPSIKID
jgi:hypothetical protein